MDEAAARLAGGAAAIPWKGKLLGPFGTEETLVSDGIGVVAAPSVSRALMFNREADERTVEMSCLRVERPRTSSSRRLSFAGDKDTSEADSFDRTKLSEFRRPSNQAERRTKCRVDSLFTIFSSFTRA